MKKFAILVILIMVTVCTIAASENEPFELIDTVKNHEGLELNVYLWHQDDGDYYTVDATRDNMWTILFKGSANEWGYSHESQLFMKHNEDGSINFVVVPQLSYPEPSDLGQHLLKGIYVNDELILVIEDHYEDETWLRLLDGNYVFNNIDYFGIAIGGWSWDEESQTLSLIPESNGEVNYYYRNEAGTLVIGNSVSITAGTPIIIHPEKAVNGEFMF